MTRQGDGPTTLDTLKQRLDGVSTIYTMKYDWSRESGRQTIRVLVAQPGEGGEPEIWDITRLVFSIPGGPWKATDKDGSIGIRTANSEQDVVNHLSRFFSRPFKHWRL